MFGKSSRKREQKGEGQKAHVERVFAPSMTTGRKRVLEAKDLWVDYFSEALGCLLGEDPMSHCSTAWFDEVVERAAYLADKALALTEHRFMGV